MLSKFSNWSFSKDYSEYAPVPEDVYDNDLQI